MINPRSHRQRGVVLLTVLVFILVSTLAASTMVVRYDTERRREREAELLFAGAQIRKAIASYYNSIPPGGARSLPPSLDVLLNDPRFLTPMRHLRRLYKDPMTGQADWEPVTGPGGIVGVRSRSEATPIKQHGFQKPFEAFDGKQRYADWVFGISYP
jgi:type II secretory pathway pseudopilin PulG